MTENTNDRPRYSWDDLWKNRPEPAPGACHECLNVVEPHTDGCSHVGEVERRDESIDLELAELRARLEALVELVERHVGRHDADW